jgi:hypothetical protein
MVTHDEPVQQSALIVHDPPDDTQPGTPPSVGV